MGHIKVPDVKIKKNIEKTKFFFVHGIFYLVRFVEKCLNHFSNMISRNWRPLAGMAKLCPFLAFSITFSTVSADIARVSRRILALRTRRVHGLLI